MTNSYDAHPQPHDLDQLQPPMHGSDHDNDRKAAIEGIRYSIAAAQRNAAFWADSADTLRRLMEKMEHQK